MPARKKAPPKRPAAKKLPAKKKAPAKTRTKTKTNPVPVSKEEDRWQTEDDLRTLTRAEEIKADKKRLAKVSSLAKEQVKNASKFVKK